MKKTITLTLLSILFFSLIPISMADIPNYDNEAFCMIKDNSDNSEAYMEIYGIVNYSTTTRALIEFPLHLPYSYFNFTLLPYQDGIIGWIIFYNAMENYNRNDILKLYSNDNSLYVETYANQTNFEHINGYGTRHIVNNSYIPNETINIGALSDITNISILLKDNITQWINITNINTEITYSFISNQTKTEGYDYKYRIYLGSPDLTDTEYNCYNGFDNINAYSGNIINFNDTKYNPKPYYFENGDSITKNSEDLGNDTYTSGFSIGQYTIIGNGEIYVTDTLPTPTGGFLDILFENEYFRYSIIIGFIALLFIIIYFTGRKK